MVNWFTPEIFMQSLPQGSAQRKNKLSLLQSKMTTAGINVFLDIFKNNIITEKDVDNPTWNPNVSLEKWMSIFHIELAILNNDYSDPVFLNYIVRFYNRLLVHRPVPISLLALNILFDEYGDLGMIIKFDSVFVLGASVLGGNEYLGIPGSSSIISIDPKAKYFKYYPVVVRLLLRVLPINASIRVNSPFAFSGEVPPYNTFQIAHDCNAPYQVTDTELIYAKGEYELNQSSVLRLELHNFLVKSEVIFDLVPFRSSEEVPSLYLSFFILNSTAQVITVNLTLQDPTQEVLTYTLSDIPSDRWTSVLIKTSDLVKANNIKSLSLQSDKNINDSHNKFYIDQVRIYTGAQNKSSDLYIETELDYRSYSSTT